MLKDARLVLDEAVGNQRIYRLNPSGIEEIRAYFDRFWDDALSSFKTFVEIDHPQKRENSRCNQPKNTPPFGHTIGGVFSVDAPPGTPEGNVAEAMKSIHFDVMGATRTFWDFFFGYRPAEFYLFDRARISSTSAELAASVMISRAAFISSQCRQSLVLRSSPERLDFS